MSTSGGSSGGGGAFLPIADSSSAWSVVEMADPINEGNTIKVLSMPDERIAFAVCVDGDQYPRFFITNDAFNSFGTGDYDPWSDGPYFSPGEDGGLNITIESSDPVGPGSLNVFSTGGINLEPSNGHHVVANLGLDVTGGGAITAQGDIKSLAGGFYAQENPFGENHQGSAILVGGTVDVGCLSVLDDSRIMLTAQDNDTIGALRVSARDAGTGFTITSSVPTDTGVVAYEIFIGTP